MAELKHPIREAERYLQNAKQILSEKAGKDGDYYTDPKYVKMAGNTAWNGVLLALDAALKVRKTSRQRVSIDDYKAALSNRNKQALTMVNTGYQVLHLFMGYDGVKSYKICQAGLEEAKKIINWAEKHYNPAKI